MTVRFSHIPQFGKLRELINTAKEKGIVPTSFSPVFFIDYNNNLTQLYIEERLHNLIAAYDTFGLSVLLSPLLEQILALKHYFPDSKVVIHIESGESLYHKKFHGGYKSERSYTYTTLSPKQVQTLREFLRLMKEILTDLFHSIPDVYVLHLRFLEADFIPYYVTSRQFFDNTFSISFSSDKDLFQQLVLDNFLAQIRQLPTIKDKRKSIVTRKTAIFAITGKEEYLSIEDDAIRKILVSNIPLALAISGDSDEFKGVPRVGYITVFKAIRQLLDKDKDTYSDILNLSKTIKATEKERINQIREIIRVLSKNTTTKALKDLEVFTELIERNFRLADFEMLSLYIDNVKTDAKDYIAQRLDDTQKSIMDLDTFKFALKELLRQENNSKLIKLYDEVLAMSGYSNRNNDTSTYEDIF